MCCGVFSKAFLIPIEHVAKLRCTFFVTPYEGMKELGRQYSKYDGKKCSFFCF